MAKRSWNLYIEHAVTDTAEANAKADGLRTSVYVERLIRRDTITRRLKAADIDDKTRAVLEHELKDLL